MPTINHKQQLNIPNTAVGGTASWKMMWGARNVLKAAGWEYAGSGDGTTVDKTSNPAADRWNGTPGTLGTLTTSGSGAVVAAPTRGRAVVTGLTGMTSVMKGQFLKITGSSVSANNNVHQIETIISATSVSINARNFAVGADAVGRAWEVRDALGEAYNAGLTSSLAWWCGVGPHTLKIPITSQPSVRMLQNERIVQATSGFEGELRDVVWNFSSNTGYLTVFGQIRGTSGGVYGLLNGAVITGQTSGSTVTQVGVAKEFRNEIVIYKATNDTTGNLWYGVFDTSTDVRFKDLVASAGCTASVPPGGGGTGNAFPTYAWAAWGNASTSFSGVGTWSRSLATSNGDCWAVCADAIEEQGYSADGSYMAGVLHRGQNHWATQGYQLCEGGDYGDLAPWVSWSPRGVDVIYAAPNRTSALPLATGGSQAITPNAILESLSSTNYKPLNLAVRGWCRRGFTGAMDQYIGLDMACWNAITDFGTSILLTTVHGMESVHLSNSTYQCQPTYSNNHEEMVKCLLQLPVGYWRTGGAGSPAFKYHKGMLRWLKVVDGGHTNELHHDGSFLQLAGRYANVAVGPFNGVAPAMSQMTAGRMYMTGGSYNASASFTPYTFGYSIYRADGTRIPSQATVPADPGGAAWELLLKPPAHCGSLSRNPGWFSAGANIFTNFNPVAGATTAARGWVSSPLAAQTISGTIKGQAYCTGHSSDTSIRTAARLYVITPTGAIRGVLRELLPQADTSGGATFTTTATNRKLFRNTTITPVVCSAGDRIVFELGIQRNGAGAGSCSIVFGDQGSDLPLDDESTTTTLLQSYIQFSVPPVFLDSAGPQS